MSENKTGQYFKYAIGEILLVVIGILIALQINNWNQDRKDNQKELALMQSWVEDLNRNIYELNRVIKKSKTIADRSDSLLYFRAGKIKIEETEKLVRLIRSVTGYTKFLSYDATITEIMNAGYLDIISNDYLRKEIATWDGDLKFLREITELAQEDSKELDILIKTHLPLFEFQKAAMNKLPFPDNKPVLDLINYEPFSNRIINRSRSFERLNEMFKEELEYHNSLIDSIITIYPKVKRPKSVKTE